MQWSVTTAFKSKQGSMKMQLTLLSFLVSLGLNISPPDPLRMNGEAPEEDTDCDGSPLPEDTPEVRTVPA